MTIRLIAGAALLSATATALPAYGADHTYPIVDTGQTYCYDSSQAIQYPQLDERYFGQDATYKGNQPSYTDNRNGTITDNVTGLMWLKSPGEKMTLNEALKAAVRCRTGGYTDWRVPTIKELYSLILFTGTDPDPQGSDTSHLVPFIDTAYFDFQYGDPAKGERIIDSQYGSSTRYTSTTMKGDSTLFGVNFADGRIKGYGMKSPRRQTEKEFYFLFVRGNKDYGKNKFHANNDGTVTDRATGLMWMQVDSGALKVGYYKDGRMNWRQALEWAEKLEFAGHSDWRLPNAKELQSIVDYTRCPAKTGSAAIDPLFKPSILIDEGGNKNYPFYWTSSTHASTRGGQAADYIAFGEALGWMQDRRTGEYQLMDVHGAGAQRSDPKSGDPSDYPYGRGPQGDVIRVGNYVLCVRGGAADVVTSGPTPQVNRSSSGRGGSNRRQQNTPSFVNRLDKNGDGKVSRDEFDGPKDHFSHLDKNGDGYLSEDEAPSGPPSRGRR